MIHPSYVDLMKVMNSGVEFGEEPVVNSRYSIVIAASKRARQIIGGDEPLIARAAGKKPLDAVISATTSRIIPVAMASGTTILGMLPLLFDAMFGGMAATIMGGLLVASALTLFVLPVAYCAIHRIKGEQ